MIKLVIARGGFVTLVNKIIIALLVILIFGVYLDFFHSGSCDTAGLINECDLSAIYLS